MLYGRALAVWVSLSLILASPAAAQSVISTHSGVIHYFEGAVYVGDQPLESHLGKFSSVPQGGVLRTEKGRAEVLLTPGVFLRVGENATVRMVANQLSDTRVELLSGSAMVESEEPASGTSVTVLYKNWSVRFPERGLYRIDSEPARLQVLRGKAEVSAGNKVDAQLVSQGMSLPFAPVLVPTPSSPPSHDALALWSEGRQQSISADNAIAANIQDPASLSLSTPDFDSFTYFPMLGLSSALPASSGVYGPLATYQPGFNSIYLPGYTYFPNYTYLLLLPMTIHSGVYPIPGGSVYAGGTVWPAHTGVGTPMPVRPLPPLPITPIGGRPAPVSPIARPVPVHPASPHNGSPGAAHAVAHR